MKSSLHYVLALSLITAPLAANDCMEDACVVEVAQPEQQEAQPFYKKVGQKLWEHKYKIAAVSAAAIAAVLLYRYSDVVFGLKTTEVKPVNNVTVTVESTPTLEAGKLDTKAPEDSNQSESTEVPTEVLKPEQPTEIAPVVNAETEKSFFEKLKENGTQVLNWCTGLRPHWAAKTAEAVVNPPADSN